MSPGPLIPNGVYKIRNSQFSTHVADLSDGNPLGKIVAWEDVETSSWDKWRVQNHGAGGNQVTIENVLVPGSFAYVQQKDAGAPLVGSRSPTLWTVVKLDQGKFYIQTEDGQLVWELPKGIDCEEIVLHHHTGQAKQKWTFK
ncbi:hypothetical protein OG21DRAFT_1500809 [Imleria badia]|nr:hypothetical protein OG21DRAFT_1500809 [Imleria badia]